METKKLIRCTLAELLGMALFVYIGCGSALSTGEFLVSSGTPDKADVARVLPIAFAFGISILVQAYSFGHVSGGHCTYTCDPCSLSSWAISFCFPGTWAAKVS